LCFLEFGIANFFDFINRHHPVNILKTKKTNVQWT
jgi:hypothetical protein